MEAVIRLRGTRDSENERERIDQTMPGSFSGENGNYTLSFSEKYNGFDNTSTVILFNSDRVNIVRDGALESELTIEPHRTHYCNYATPFGSFTVTVTGLTIDFELDENGGALFVDYLIDHETGTICRTKMEISFEGLSSEEEE
ncbi:MAG: DUF1934 domain-containing protein [Clostridia bacterium]|nr:DUF1934 domain-containing protein [Clostridia bacterium]